MTNFFWFVFRLHIFNVFPLSSCILLSGCKMAAVPPGITSTFKSGRMQKGEDKAYLSFYQDRKKFPRILHSILPVRPHWSKLGPMATCKESRMLGNRIVMMVQNNNNPSPAPKSSCVSKEEGRWLW